MPIHFFSEGIAFKPKNQRKKNSWIKLVAQKEGKSISEISFVFTSDPFLSGLNLTYLKHKTLTDIITFDYSTGKTVSGDIFISVERVQDNSLKFNTSFDDELDRVIIHGVLHLFGYKDKRKGQKILMRKKENAYLSLR
ncbi:MAG: rRNA maturation RNase YbeY [Bacteroidetes bacterium]|nr:rRNA maturation RNase YbeY [Bacteroidota bacterium]